MRTAAEDTTTGIAANAAATAAAADMAAGTAGATKTTTKAEMQKKTGIGEQTPQCPSFLFAPRLRSCANFYFPKQAWRGLW